MANPYVEVQPRSDAYTGILIVSLVTLLIGCLLLFLDYNQYGTSTPPAPTIAPLRPAEGGGPKGVPAGGPGAGGAGMMGGGGAPAGGGAAKDAK